MPNNRLKLCMLSGSFEYDSEASLAIFHEYIEKNHPIQATQIIYQSEDDDQSLEPLQDTDVLLVFTRRLNTTGKELDRFKAYCAEGKPIVGVRTASHAYQNWIAFDKDVLGGDYQGHYGGGVVAHTEINIGAKDHPILQNIMVDEIRENYNLPILEDDMGVEWQANSDLQGGTLIREVYNYYWTRINLSSAQNIIPPSEDVRHTRFLPFNLRYNGNPRI